MNYVDVYDMRLGSHPPKQKIANTLVLTVNEYMPLAATFGTIRAWATRRPISVLRLFGHGHIWELKLGKESLSRQTAMLCRLLDGSFQKDALISLYTCQAVELLAPTSGPGANEFSSSLASYVKDIARICGVTVLGAKDLQNYDPATLDFGRWEGTLYAITPTGVVIRVPNLGSWLDGAKDAMRTNGLSNGVMDRIYDEVVRKHPDYVSDEQKGINGLDWVRGVSPKFQ